MKYIDFVDREYLPTDRDLVCDFRLETSGTPIDVVAGCFAAESLIGTWTKLTTVKPYMEGLQARAPGITWNSVRPWTPDQSPDASRIQG